jgi:hypothetical protein
MPLAQAGRRAPTPAAQGVYLLERYGIPIYVGMSRTFRTRLPRHIHRFGTPGVTARFGLLVGGNETLRRAAEHALIRTLLRGGWSLANQRSVRPLTVDARQTLQVYSYGDRPPSVPREIIVAGKKQDFGKTQYELLS